MWDKDLFGFQASGRHLESLNPLYCLSVEAAVMGTSVQSFLIKRVHSGILCMDTLVISLTRI